MTTNQTIDGVRRELIERTRRELTAGTPSIATLAELRALLDAPVVRRQEPKGAILRFREYVGKGQGGRDIWHDWTEWSTGTVEYAKTKLDQVKDLTNVQFEVEWLYAEQPAPVAVVPEQTYRLLGDGDVIMDGDETLNDDTATWGKVPMGVFIGMPYNRRVMLPVRRAKP